MTRMVIVAALALASCSKSESPKSEHIATTVVNKDPAAARKLIAAGATVLDVRTPEEFADGHLPSATNLPVEDVAQRIAEVDKLVGGDKTKPVVVYCSKGGRAAKAKQALEASGYTNVVNGGGFGDLR
ncbi:MAG: rhodanese-like domain-containing protein [Deltaproteobacteria bacterium]